MATKKITELTELAAGSIAGTGSDEFLHSDGPGHNKDVDTATGTNTA